MGKGKAEEEDEEEEEEEAVGEDLASTTHKSMCSSCSRRILTLKIEIYNRKTIKKTQSTKN